MSDKSNTTNKELFLAAYTEHADALLRYIFFKISDRERAVELVQDVFMKTWNFLKQDGEVKNIKAFMYKLASNIVIDEYRKRKPLDSLDTLSEDSGFEPSFDDTGQWADRLDGAEAMKLLQKIPESYAEAIVWRYVDDLSLSEIAEITGETENTIAVRIHRGIAKLQKLFTHEH